ncbi:hypothetical protein A2334_00280 [Candidatus Roizmanbacteria bacterium RIFOXYB2_FULL_38_10]|uniref:Uncharacterized protein n=1 Tax=Candidatus Roizmanbacteria bacterium RIFOXYD1_FULL_38_12 TaxID=1802093 RepID=A0A1F7L2A6_9BACT|nr:MAG: hypothetical protein A3K47_05825 [Candidatus Roizmanbacteria bacterium RIFOXYA2_FULL_38_14]OGK64260.1 MAG: hypothetical protein A3K27_05825 [Candidatus Roizmanbacteria bacterium RIFOXYA1_FULL_37_12]OGK66106.1 MAG: hypothetical protein A3K38_05825 [Candidatus Roizmanbacteria bacterium RIFOXYB1_FULL_40_23]OGK67671.1 MAG: hypothetical protein A2334_00280 [Candidatus Roizmanbacteria bacterium RIFOXYB2_FULL_38_10]OGK70511.1 MAG: hypothetical protein A3K21_05830 [Candidatus Roizmanbacteria ba
MELLTKHGTHNNPVIKVIAAILFILFPIIGFAMGIQYQSIQSITNIDQIKTNADSINKTESNLNIQIDSNLKYIRLGNKYFDLNKTPDSSIGQIPNTKWFTILESNKEFGKTAKMFDYKIFPNTSVLIFTLALDPTLSTNEGMILYKTYFYNGNKSILVYESVWSYSHHPSVPRIGEISKDGQYLTLYIYGCWNCGGSAPETHIIDLKNSDNNYKNLGPIEKITWGNSGAYSYVDKTGKTISGSLKYPVD